MSDEVVNGVRSSAQTKADIVTIDGIVDAILVDVTNLDGSAMYSSTMVGTNSAALASVLGALNSAAATGAVTTSDLLMAYMKQRVTQGVAMMLFASAPAHIIVIPATGADLVFPSVAVAGLPTGANLLRVDMALVIGALFNADANENQIKTGTTDQIWVMKTGASWGTDDIACLEFTALSLQVKTSEYRGGCVLFGAIDIKGEVDANATYEFQSRETNRTKGVECTATGAGGIELLDVTTIIRVWFN